MIPEVEDEAMDVQGLCTWRVVGATLDSMAEALYYWTNFVMVSSLLVWQHGEPPKFSINILFDTNCSR